MNIPFPNYKCFYEALDAILVEDIKGKQTWIPKSEIVVGSEVHKEGTSGVLLISDQYAKRLNWVDLR